MCINKVAQHTTQSVILGPKELALTRKLKEMQNTRPHLEILKSESALKVDVQRICMPIYF